MQWLFDAKVFQVDNAFQLKVISIQKLKSIFFLKHFKTSLIFSLQEHVFLFASLFLLFACRRFCKQNHASRLPIIYNYRNLSWSRQSPQGHRSGNYAWKSFVIVKVTTNRNASGHRVPSREVKSSVSPSELPALNQLPSPDVEEMAFRKSLPLLLLGILGRIYAE